MMLECGIHAAGRRIRNSGGTDADWAAPALQLRLYITACLRQNLMLELQQGLGITPHLQ